MNSNGFEGVACEARQTSFARDNVVVKVLLILFFSVLPLSASDDISGGSFWRQLTWGGLILYSIRYLFSSEKDVFRPRRFFGWPLILLVVWAGVTVFWSPYLMTSLKRYVLFLGAIWIVSVISLESLSREVWRSLAMGVVFLIFLSLIVVLAFPGYGIMVDPPGWRGVTTHKNEFGQLALLGVILWINEIYKAREKGQILLGCSFFVLCLVSLVFSKSTTSLIAFGSVLIASFVAIYFRMVLRYRFIWLFFALSIFVTVVHFLFVMGFINLDVRLDDLFFSVLGKSSTLTGRTYIWEVMGDQIARHPWFGVGYGGFWVGLMGGAAEVTRLVQWGYPGQAHNGFIDVLNELGVIGLGLLILFLLSQVWQIIKLSLLGRPVFVHVLVTVAAIVLNVTEATFLRSTHIWWLLIVLSYFDIKYQLMASKKG